MIDLPTQKDMASPHHRRAVWALIAASVVFAGLIVAYFLRPTSVSAPRDTTQDTSAARQALMGQPVPTLDLTAAQIKSRQVLLGKPAPSLKLTPEQIKARQALMGQ